MASVSLVPRGVTDIQAALSTLQFNFELHDTIAKELLRRGVCNLEEFVSCSKMRSKLHVGLQTFTR